MSWKVTLPCTRVEAKRIAEADLDGIDRPPVLLTTLPDPAEPDRWRLDAYFEREPSRGRVNWVRALAPSAAGARPRCERVEDEDWVTLSQQGLEPIRAGRFFVHTPAHRGRVLAGAIGLEIDAGRAFGTGQHETTAGCLVALTRLRESGLRFADIADIGTGTGLLAFAAIRLWPAARAIASDIDPVAIEVARENAAINRVPIGRARGRLELAVAAGMQSSRLRARAPYDLLIANILADPLVELAPSLAGALAPGGRLLLAGLLTSQADAVLAAYRRQGLSLTDTVQRGDWPTLVLRKRRAYR